MAIPHLLFRFGSKPGSGGGGTKAGLRSLAAFWAGGAASAATPVGTTKAGLRSLLAFWAGGAAASGTVVIPPAPTPSPGGWIAGHGKHFSHKRWKELLEAIAAQQALEARAQEVTGKRRDVLERAAQAGEAAILSVEDEETVEHSAELVVLTNLMNAATGVARLADVVRKANAATAFALEMDDEEEEAIMLLMLH